MARSDAGADLSGEGVQRHRTLLAICAALWLLGPSLALARAEADAPPDPETLLRRGITANLAADHDATERILAAFRAHYPEHPAGSYLEEQTLFWKLFHDHVVERYDADIVAMCERTIALSKAWLEREPDNARAHFYAGLGYMDLGRLRGFRGSYYAAGRAGEQAREHLEKALEARPDWVDARFQLGAYYFYASLIPQLVTRWLGWLWFIPTSDADRGLADIREVAESGDLFREEARITLANIYTYHRPEQLPEAVAMLKRSAERFEGNPLIRFELVEVLFASKRYEETIATCLAIENDPRDTPEWIGRKNMARVWRARAELMLYRPERALELLEPYATAPPSTPLWGAPWVDLTRAQAYDVLGERDRAVALYEKSIAYERPTGSRRVAESAKEYLERPFDVGPRLEARGGG